MTVKCPANLTTVSGHSDMLPLPGHNNKNCTLYAGHPPQEWAANGWMGGSKCGRKMEKMGVTDAGIEHSWTRHIKKYCTPTNVYVWGRGRCHAHATF